VSGGELRECLNLDLSEPGFGGGKVRGTRYEVRGKARYEVRRKNIIQEEL
jgi:hypothetical protein